MTTFKVSSAVQSIHIFLNGLLAFFVAEKSLQTISRLTFKKRADFSPTCYSTLSGILAQSCLQEEEWDATGEQKQNIRYEENTFKIKKEYLVKIMIKCKHL